MPTVTGTGKHFTKKRKSGYFDDLLVNNTMKLLTKYSICPPHDVEGDKGKLARQMDVSSYGREKPMHYARMMRGKKVAYIHLYKEPRMQVGSHGASNEGGDVIKFEASYDEDAGTPIYFLPWDDRGAIVRLTIPSKGTNDPDPDIFFTAAINGCSIFIQGDPTNPTVFHAGGETEKSDPGEAAKFWRKTLKRHVLGKTNVDRGTLVSEVNKTHYIKTPGVTGGTTQRASDYENLLKQSLDKKGKFQVSMVNPWGCVMGIRTNDRWKFYLQENATVVCLYFNKKGSKMYSYARPMILKEFYPGGGHSVNLKWAVPPVIG